MILLEDREREGEGERENVGKVKYGGSGLQNCFPPV